MIETFISKIVVEYVRNMGRFEIPFSNNKRKHLIITGNNGCGKTTLLQSFRSALDDFTKFSRHGELDVSPEIQKDFHLVDEDTKISYLEKLLLPSSDVSIYFNNSKHALNSTHEGSFLIAYFNDERRVNVKTPNGITKVDLKSKYNLYPKASPDFIQFIVNLKADKSFARDDGNIEEAEKIEAWFKRFENRLKNLFGSEDLKLKFNRKDYNFDIIEPGKEPYRFNTLSSGYSAIINIVTELILRMEAHNAQNYDLQGVVLIDEIETHLHVELQKKILPFLIDFFPKIQFIVTTHSPFVISSIKDAVVCDLESRFIAEDLSTYSYDALIESYFNSDKYSLKVHELIKEYESLSSKAQLGVGESERLEELKELFDNIPNFMNKELIAKIQSIQLKSLTR